MALNSLSMSTSDDIHLDTVTLVSLKPWHIKHVKALHAIWTDPGATRWRYVCRKTPLSCVPTDSYEHVTYGANHDHSTLPTPAKLRDSEPRLKPMIRIPLRDDRRGWAVFRNDDIELVDCLGYVGLLPVARVEEDVPAWDMQFMFKDKAWDALLPPIVCKAALSDLESDLLGTKKGSWSLLSLRSGVRKQKGIVFVEFHVEDDRSKELCKELGFLEKQQRKVSDEKVLLAEEWRVNKFMLQERCFEHDIISPLVLFDDDDNTEL